MQIQVEQDTKKKSAHTSGAPPERVRETVLAYQCHKCCTNGYVMVEGTVTCSCGAEFFVSETEGLLPAWPIFGRDMSGNA